MTHPIRMVALAKIVGLALGLGTALPATADTALLIGNERYDNLSNMRGARFARQGDLPLQQAGFDVYAGMNVETHEMRAGLSQIVEAGEDTRILIQLIGHFVQSDDGETWFLGTEAERPDRGNVGGQGIALSTILAIAAEAPGRAIVVLGTDAIDLPLGAGLRTGVATPEPPQGVAVVVTAARTASNLVRDQLAEPGVVLSEALRGLEAEFEVAGFVPDFLPFIAAPQDDVLSLPPAPIPSLPSSTGIARDNDSAGDAPGNAERDLWRAVQELNTEGAYISYLQRYPTGQYAAQARAAFDALRDPVRLAAEEEQTLDLDRNDRREIQSDLTVLGFDTNGIDGIFGNGTRSAIRGWQASVGLDETGHLNTASLRRLATSADIRREEIAAEEAIRQAERDRLDRAYWTATGQGQDEAGLRAYLGRYPDGLFADVATARLDQIEGDREQAAAAEEEAAWDFATRQDSIRAYRGYIAAYPQGVYERMARNRIAELRGDPPPYPDENIANLEAAEAALNLPGITRMLIERRLSDQGYNPGTPDGRFDDQTRTAIRAFQEANGLTATGYLDQRTLGRFLSDGFQVIIR